MITTHGRQNVLAPMVRLGTLPLRMVAHEYGADIVYTEELIDRKLLACSRIDNAALGTIDFVDPGGCLVLRTTAEEKPRLVVQIGSADAELALAAASLVAGDCGGVDVNMGCPVHFSTSGGMGSALLKKPDTAAEIVRTLSRALPVPVSCKIRLLESEAATVAFARLMEGAGASAVAVHGRYVSQRPREPAHWAQIVAVVQALRVPVIANGDVFEHADFERLRVATGAAASMCARGAQWNASIFRSEGLLPPADVRRAYAAACIRWGNNLGNSKHCLREMLIADIGLESPEGRALAAAKSDAAFFALYKGGIGRKRDDDKGDQSASRAPKQRIL
jgi:tRNA-dihydrouridine synthase 2